MTQKTMTFDVSTVQKWIGVLVGLTALISMLGGGLLTAWSWKGNVEHRLEDMTKSNERLQRDVQGLETYIRDAFAEYLTRREGDVP